ncbi:MAG: hypothetical protein HY976_03990 [Candidatus Kerfeldbacteria bacterium]|nr:hypothetical protein [Candidatus Kerfeldbacteria bacterium]
MKRTDFISFGFELAKVAAQKRIELPEHVLESYFEDLSEYDLEFVIAAIRRARRELVYFPQPAEIIERVKAIKHMEFERRVTQQHALQAPPLTQDEQAQCGEARKTFFEFVARLSDRWKIGSKSRHVFPPVSDADRSTHEARKKKALERLRKA